LVDALVVVPELIVQSVQRVVVGLLLYSLQELLVLLAGAALVDESLNLRNAIIHFLLGHAQVLEAALLR